jgi:hypothetical protein
MQFRPCSTPVTMGIWEGFCTIVWHDPYGRVHPRMTSVQPGEDIGGIVKAIEGHHKGERDFICVGFQCGIVESATTRFATA